MKQVNKYTDQLLEIVSNKDAKFMLESIKYQCFKLQHRGYDLVDSNLVKKSEWKANTDKFVLKDAVQEVIDHCNADPVRVKKLIRLHNFYSDGIPKRVKGDKQRLQQVLLNLVSNGINYTEKGGDVACLTKFVEGKRKKDSSYIKVSVKDTGVGISQESIPRLFKQFGRLRANQTMNSAGLGLGLFACKEICENMGGGIKLTKSAVGGGCTFAFNMKLKKVAQADLGIVVEEENSKGSENNSFVQPEEIPMTLRHVRSSSFMMERLPSAQQWRESVHQEKKILILDEQMDDIVSENLLEGLKEYDIRERTQIFANEALLVK